MRRHDRSLVHGLPVGGVDQRADLTPVERLALEQGPRHRVEPTAVATQQLDGPLFLLAQDPGDLGVDHASGVF